MTRFPNGLIVASVMSLVAATVLGGVALSAIEDIAFMDGLWQSFSVVSTTGFEGPTTAAGQLVAIALFGWAVLAYSLLLFSLYVRARRRAALDDLPRGRRVVVERDVQRVVRSLSPN